MSEFFGFSVLILVVAYVSYQVGRVVGRSEVHGYLHGLSLKKQRTRKK